MICDGDEVMKDRATATGGLMMKTRCPGVNQAHLV
jgi:hypothetical protein